MIEGAKTVVSSGEARTAASAKALARKNRVRWISLAPIAEKKRNRSARSRSAADSRRAGGEPVQLDHGRLRLVADRRRKVDHRVDAAQRLALEVRVAQARQISERELHVHPQPPEASRVADQHADFLAPFQQQGEERLADRPRGASEQDHRVDSSHARRGPCLLSRLECGARSSRALTGGLS